MQRCINGLKNCQTIAHEGNTINTRHNISGQNSGLTHNRVVTKSEPCMSLEEMNATNFIPSIPTFTNPIVEPEPIQAPITPESFYKDLLVTPKAYHNAAQILSGVPFLLQKNPPVSDISILQMLETGHVGENISNVQRFYTTRKKLLGCYTIDYFKHFDKTIQNNLSAEEQKLYSKLPVEKVTNVTETQGRFYVNQFLEKPLRQRNENRLPTKQEVAVSYNNTSNRSPDYEKDLVYPVIQEGEKKVIRWVDCKMTSQPYTNNDHLRGVWTDYDNSVVEAHTYLSTQLTSLLAAQEIELCDQPILESLLQDIENNLDNFKKTHDRFIFVGVFNNLGEFYEPFLTKYKIGNPFIFSVKTLDLNVDPSLREQFRENYKENCYSKDSLLQKACNKRIAAGSKEIIYDPNTLIDSVTQDILK